MSFFKSQLISFILSLTIAHSLNLTIDLTIKQCYSGYMKTQELILEKARSGNGITTSQIVKLTGISRQTIAEHFRKLVGGKKLIKTGSTHNAKYFLYDKNKDKLPELHFTKQYSIKDLEEDLVFQEISLKMGFKKLFSSNGYKITNYAFTEMLNNAIDHSKSAKVQVYCKSEKGNTKFEIVDRGIGVYESIRKKFKLKNHFEACEHLLKGKQTTDERKHSGEGIFFTSKIADQFILHSAELKLVIDNDLEDIYLDTIKTLKGTKVAFIIKQKTRKSLSALFKEYQNSEDEFDTTKLSVSISLYEKGGEHISRSEAKRILFGLEKFKRIIFDFKRVKGIGQGFADEIFRVFKLTYPSIKIETINMSPSVEFMVKRVKSHK